jgi:hypothetical protein
MFFGEFFKKKIKISFPAVLAKMLRNQNVFFKLKFSYEKYVKFTSLFGLNV